jgi:hypothetical protein
MLSYQNKTINKGLIIVSFFIYPLYTIPFLIKHILLGEKWSYFLFSFFLGVLAYLLIPYDTWDITRHYLDFIEIKEMSFQEVFSLGGSHLFLNIIMWHVNAIGLPKETVPLLFTAITYSIHSTILLYIYNDYSSKHRGISKQTYFLLFSFVLFNVIRFSWLADGLRNPSAFSVSLLGIYFILSKGKTIKGVLTLFIATFIHPSSALIILIVFITKGKISNLLLRILFVISLILIVTNFSEIAFYSIVDKIRPFLVYMGIADQSYFSSEGHWGAGFWSSFNFKTYVLEKFIKPMPFYIAGIYLLVVKNSVVPKYRRFIYLLFFIISVISISRTLFDRYVYFAILFFITMLMIEYRIQPFNRFKKIFLIFFISSLLLADLANIYKYRDTWIPSWHKIIYLPMPILLLENIEPDEYIIRHAND